MPDPKPLSIPCSSTARAVELVSKAHSLGLSASYHPHGGMTATRYTPVTHTVWVTGTRKQLNTLKHTLTEKP